MSAEALRREVEAAGFIESKIITQLAHGESWPADRTDKENELMTTIKP
ncbi:MAG: hypothetical protein R2854_06060 [Caldilineaceae bacterium]